MAKIRVYELARELKMESKVLVAEAKALGIALVSHQSTLTPPQVAKIRSVLWVAIQFITFWNSYKKGRGDPDDDITDTQRDQKSGENRNAEPDD